jgi:hypothetical protein
MLQFFDQMDDASRYFATDISVSPTTNKSSEISKLLDKWLQKFQYAVNENTVLGVIYHPDNTKSNSKSNIGCIKCIKYSESNNGFIRINFTFQGILQYTIAILKIRDNILSIQSDILSINVEWVSIKNDNIVQTHIDTLAQRLSTYSHTQRRVL